MQGIAAAGLVLVTGFLVPAGNQVFRETVYAASLGTAPRAGVPARGLQELQAGELSRRAYFGSGRNPKTHDVLP